MPKLAKSSYPEYYEVYIAQVSHEKDLIENLIETKENALTFLKSIPSNKENFANEPGKWTIKEVLQHCIDTERIFNMRALCFARNDQSALPGFEQAEYAQHAHVSERSFSLMIDEFETLRNSSIFLFESFTDEALGRIGTASNTKISVEAIGYILSGHITHHLAIIQDRYL